MVIFAVLVVLLYLTALSGIVALIVTDRLTPSAVQPLKASELKVPMPLPARPLPLLSVPLRAEDVQVTERPAVTSFTVVAPAVPVTAPPGLTVQVVAASAGAAAKPITDAAAAPRTRDLPKALKITLTPFPCRFARRRAAIRALSLQLTAKSPETVTTHTWTKGTGPPAA